jgi:hypothetical protein
MTVNVIGLWKPPKLTGGTKATTSGIAGLADGL